MERGADRRVVASAASALRWSVGVKREFSWKAKLSIYRSVSHGGEIISLFTLYPRRSWRKWPRSLESAAETVAPTTPMGR